MNGATTESTWVEANQRYLVAEFARLKGRLGGEGGPETGVPVMEDIRAILSAPAAIDVLATSFGLSPFERDLLLVCAGVEMDAELAQLCGHAQGHLQRTHVTFGLALSRLEASHWSALTPVGPLRRWRLLEVDDSAGLAGGRLRIDERILHYLAGVNYLDTRLRPLFRLKPPVTAMAGAHRQVGASILALLEDRMSQSPVVMVTGDDREGQGDVAVHVATELGLHLYALSAESLPTGPAEVEALAILWQREAVLLTATVIVECGDRDIPKQVSSFVDRLGGLVFITGQEAPSVARPSLRAAVNKPEAVDQRALWEQALGPAATRLNGSLDGIASQFRLSAQTILRTGQELRGALAVDDTPDDLLWRACRGAGRSKLGELAQRIDPASEWESLILPTSQKATLRAITAHVRHRLAVYHDWGFAGRGMRGLGITALFAGESGTGKTMAAEVLANELHLDLYRIDLSSVVSKYIGDTEKNLRRVFDAAEESGAILLFDEADALFGKRSEVKDSHDRYANIEVSYLLQRMEAYRGLAILTTNMKAALDQAFQRRLRFVIQFPFPDLAQREAIWRSIFPAATPVDRLGWAKLARLQVAGGSIRNIALNAAFLAAQSQEPVGMIHLLEAAHAEAGKRERPLSDAETKGWV